MDEGQPSSYLLLANDTAVYCSDGLTAGSVKEVLREPQSDIFDGLVVATRHGERYVAAELVAAIHERGVDVTISYEQIAELPAPAPHRHVKYDLASGPHPWSEVLHWLVEHLDALLHPDDPRVARARDHLAEREKAQTRRRESAAGARGRRRTTRSAGQLPRRPDRHQPRAGRGHRDTARHGRRARAPASCGPRADRRLLLPRGSRQRP